MIFFVAMLLVLVGGMLVKKSNPVTSGDKGRSDVQNTSKKAKKLNSLNKSLKKKHFIGVYVKTSSENVRSIESFGTANGQVSFSDHTIVPIGDLQVLFNKYVLSDLLNRKKISTTKNLHDFFKNIPESSHITIKDVLTGKKLLYISQKGLINLPYDKSVKYIDDNINVASPRSKETSAMNGQIMAVLISKIYGNDYQNVMSKYFRKLKFQDVEFYNGQKLGVMDAVSYKKHSSDGILLQDRQYNNGKRTHMFGSNNLKMSIADINHLFKLVDKNFGQEGYKHLSNTNISGNAIILTTGGFTIGHQADDNKSALVISNYAGFNIEKIIENVFSSY